MKTQLTAAFTFIEILIALSVIAICFLPLMQMFSLGLDEGLRMSDLATARYLAQDGMEKLKNLAFTEEQLVNIGDVWEPKVGKELVINNRKWKVRRFVKKGTNPLEVHIQVYEEPVTKGKKPLVELVTLIEDLE